jgi:hypothetical protein
MSSKPLKYAALNISAVQVDSRSQFNTGLYRLSRLAIQRAEAEVTVGLERAHAKPVGQGEGLLVVYCGRLDLRRIAMSVDRTKQPECPCLVSSFPTLAG